MKSIILSFFFILFSLTNKAQDQLYPIKEHGYYGFIDSLGQVKIPPKFKNVGYFSEGLAAARKNGRFGYINTKGVFIIPPKYDYVEAFKNGIAKVYLDKDNFNWIDQQGNEAFKPPSIQKIKDTDDFGMIRAYGKILSQEEKTVKIVTKNGEIKSCTLEKGRATSIGFSEKGYFLFTYYSNNETKWGVAHIEKGIVIEPIYNYIDYRGIKNNIILAKKGEQFCYINLDNQVLWEHKNSKDLKPHFLNLDRQFPLNKIKKVDFKEKYDIHEEIETTTQPVFQLDKTIKIHSKYNFYYQSIHFINTTTDTISLTKTGEFVPFSLLAKDSNNVWRTVATYYNFSWCGNSYYEETLLPKHSIHFDFPLFEGTVKTKMCAIIDYQVNKTGIHNQRDIELLSEEFDGWINPGQLWKENYGERKNRKYFDLHPSYYIYVKIPF